MIVVPTGVAAFLAGWDLDRGPVDSIEPLDVGRHLPELSRQKLVGVARAALDAGALEVDDPQALVDAHERAMAEVLVLEDALLAALDGLSAASIDTLVLKGSALAHLLGPDPSERTFGDTDLLVPGDALPDAAAVLERLGARRVQPGVSPTYERRFAKSVTLRWRSDTELDLHRTLAPGPYGLMVDADAVFRHTTAFELAGREVATATVELHLVHGALHVALGDVEPRLGNVRDVALLLRHDLDLDLVMRTVESWGCAHPVALGLRAAGAIGAGDHPLLDWADSRRPTRRDRRLIESYRDRSGRFRRQSLASLRVLSWPDRIAFLRSFASARR